jgi:hypothetical protein
LARIVHHRSPAARPTSRRDDRSLGQTTAIRFFFWKTCQVSGTGLRTLLAPELSELALNEENPTGWWWAGGSYPHSLQGTPNSDTSGTHTSGISEKRPHGQTIEHVRAPKTLPDLPSLLARHEIGPVPQNGQAQGAPDFRGVQLQVVFTDSLENLTSFCLGTRSPHALYTSRHPLPWNTSKEMKTEKCSLSPSAGSRPTPDISLYSSPRPLPGRGPTDLVFFSVAPRPQVPRSRTRCAQNTRHGWGCDPPTRHFTPT